MEIKDLAGFGETATVFVNRVADYMGVSRKPKQIALEGEAQTLTDVRDTLTRQAYDPNSSDEQRLVARGLLSELGRTTREQRNKEKIFFKALPEIKEDAKPEEVEEDWVATFFDKSRLVSDEEMQILWAKVLAGEVNNPGTFSRRTISLLSSLNKKDVEYFMIFSRFLLNSKDFGLIPLIYSLDDEIYKEASLSRNVIRNLEETGLYSFVASGDLSVGFLKYKDMIIKHSLNYFSTQFIIEFDRGLEEFFYRGEEGITNTSKELASLFVPERVEGFEDYLIKKWKSFGFKVTVIRPGQPPYEA